MKKKKEWKSQMNKMKYIVNGLIGAIFILTIGASVTLVYYGLINLT